MLAHAIRHTMLFVAFAALPRLAGAAGPTDDATVGYGTAYYGATTAYQRSLYYCDQKPPELQDACRDGADARYGYPASGYRNERSEQRPAYLAYYYPSPPEYVPAQRPRPRARTT